MNPDFFLFDHWAIEQGGALAVRFPLPYADLTHIDPAILDKRMAEHRALEFSHSFEDQIGGQLAAGLLIAGFYEDRWSDEATPLNSYMSTSMATLAIKPSTDWFTTRDLVLDRRFARRPQHQQWGSLFIRLIVWIAAPGFVCPRLQHARATDGCHLQQHP